MSAQDKPLRGVSFAEPVARIMGHEDEHMEEAPELFALDERVDEAATHALNPKSATVTLHEELDHKSREREVVELGSGTVILPDTDLEEMASGDTEIQRHLADIDQLENHPIHAQIVRAEKRLADYLALPSPSNPHMAIAAQRDARELQGKIDELVHQRDSVHSIPAKIQRAHTAILQRRIELSDERTVSGRQDLESQIARLEASLRSRYGVTVVSGYNLAANRERRQLIDLKEQLALHDHDHLPESDWPKYSTRERTLEARAIQRENIQIRARNAHKELNSAINAPTYVVAVAATAYATNYIANMFGYGF